MRNKYTLLLIVLLALTTSLFNCGGGGGGNTPGPNPIPLKTNTIRTIQTGDTWNFSGSGTFTSYGSSIDISASGSETILSSTKQDPITSTNCLDDFLTISVSGPAGAIGSLSGHTYVLQDSTGTVYVYGGNDGTVDTWVSAESGGYYVDSQSPVATNQSYGNSTTYSDGSTETTSIQVTGTDYVSAPAGYFETYKILLNSTYTYTDGTSAVESNVIWYVPGLGTVKETISVTYYTGTTVTGNLTLTLFLTSTSVAY